MKNRDLQEKRLNEFEKKTLEAAALPENEIEKILGNPQIFNSIAARIEVQKSARKRENIFAGRQIFSGSNRRVIGFSFAALLLILLATGLIFRQTENFRQSLTAGKIEIESGVNDLSASVSPIETLPQSTNNSHQSAKRINFKPQAHKANARKIFSKENAKSRQPSPQKMNVKSSPETAIAPEKIFYSLAVPNNAEIGSGERHIVRAELSRPALFALGVNVAAGGDDNKKFKTDLLVGADGVPQAIRFVE